MKSRSQSKKPFTPLRLVICSQNVSHLVHKVLYHHSTPQVVRALNAGGEHLCLQAFYIPCAGFKLWAQSSAQGDEWAVVWPLQIQAFRRLQNTSKGWEKGKHKMCFSYHSSPLCVHEVGTGPVKLLNDVKGPAVLKWERGCEETRGGKLR